MEIQHETLSAVLFELEAKVCRLGLVRSDEIQWEWRASTQEDEFQDLCTLLKERGHAPLADSFLGRVDLPTKKETIPPEAVKLTIVRNETAAHTSEVLERTGTGE